MEFYCNRDTACDISNYNIIAYDPSFGDFSISFPAGTIFPARSYLLLGDNFGYSLSSYASLDLNASGNGDFDFYVDNEGFQLTNSDDTVVIDSVGFIGGGQPTTGDPSAINYIEGTGLQRATGARPADQYAYVRKMGTATAGRPQDTDNNADDFTLVSVTGTPHPGITAPPVLGAPGPQNAAFQTIERNQTIPNALVEPNALQSSAPNRVRTGSGNSGTLSIRRSFTNNTTQNITFLTFRAIDITTLNSPSTVPSQAQLRLVTSGDAETFVNSQGRTVVIKGTALEFDDGETEPDQLNGGGLNSSASVDLGPDGVIAPGETVDVQFLLNVIQSGNFRFYVNVEASVGPALPPPAIRSTARRTATTPRVVTPRLVDTMRHGGAIRSKGGIKSTTLKPVAPKAVPTVVKPISIKTTKR